MATKEEIAFEIDRRTRLMRRLKKNMRMIVADMKELKTGSGIVFTVEEQAAIDTACPTVSEALAMESRLRDAVTAIRQEVGV